MEKHQTPTSQLRFFRVWALLLGSCDFQLQVCFGFGWFTMYVVLEYYTLLL